MSQQYIQQPIQQPIDDKLRAYMVSYLIYLINEYDYSGTPTTPNPYTDVIHIDALNQDIPQELQTFVIEKYQHKKQKFDGEETSVSMLTSTINLIICIAIIFAFLYMLSKLPLRYIA